MALRLFILLVLGWQAGKAVNPDIPRHYQYRAIVFENLADEILNSAAKQNVTLYKNQILPVIQNNLNPVLDEVILQSDSYGACISTDYACIDAEIIRLKKSFPAKIENDFFNFYNYQKYIWTKIYIAPKRGWNSLNAWYPQFIKTNFNLEYDTLDGECLNNFYLNTRVMFYRLKEEVYPGQTHVSKSLFTAYYNHCAYVLKQSSIISYEFTAKAAEVDSIMNIASSIESVYKESAVDIANVYIAAAFNDNFPLGTPKDDMINMFTTSNYLLEKALSHHESGKVHYALGALYNNFLVDYSTAFSTPEKLELFGKSIVPTDLMEKAVEHLEQACALDSDYCNLKKFKDKRPGKR